MRAPPLRVCSPDRSAHAEGVVELCARTFNPYYEFREMCRGWYLVHGPYDWEASAVGLLGGEVVSHWGVWPYRMRIGEAAVSCGGIGAVATSPEHRGRGFMAATAPHSIARMRERGYAFSVLFGIDDFYHRFGYVPAWPEEIWHLQRDAIPRDLPPVRQGRLAPLPSAETARLHNRANAGLTGTAIRPTYTGAYTGKSHALAAHGWRDAGGELQGHVVVRELEGALVCTEATGAPDAILSVLRRLAMDRELKELRFVTLPYRSALAARLRQLTCRLERRFSSDGDALARVIGLEACLRGIESELSARLRDSELRDYRGVLAIGGDGEVVRLGIGGGKVAVVERGPAASSIRLGARAAQLLIGTADPQEVCDGARARPRGDAARLLRVLFPAQHPQLHRADRF